MAAVNLYKAGYQQAQKTNQLNEWAQLVNKMTGVLSTKAMGISAAQRSIEGTFFFMSARFTRASGAILGDIIAHPTGYTAKQAGTSLVALLAAWVALAFAVNGAQDKETNLNPADPDFMKVYIGNRYVRLGGIINDIRRLAAVVDSIAYYTSGKNISLSDKEDNTQPLDELLFNQFKGKTSPITGTAIDVTRKLTDETATDFEGNPLTWTGILGDWITPAWTDPIINSELESASGAASEILGLTSAVVKASEKAIDINNSIAKLGTENKEELEKALEQAEKDKLSDEAIEEIKNKDWTYDIPFLRKDIIEAIKYLDEDDIKELPLIAQYYYKYSQEEDEFNKLSEKEKEKYLEKNSDFATDYIFWKGLVTISTLEQANALVELANKYDIAPDMIPAFQLTDKGKERIPINQDLWEGYFEYYDLPSSSYFGIEDEKKIQEYIDNGKLDAGMLKVWQQYRNVKTDTAKNAMKRKYPIMSMGTWRDDYRRANPELDSWLIENKELSPLAKKSTSYSSSKSISPVKTSTPSMPSISRPSNKISYPKFKKPRLSMSINAPKVGGF